MRTNGWRTVLLVTWVGTFACMLAVAVSSRTIGRPIWWLGPSTSPAPVFLVAVPIVIVFAPLAAVMRRPDSAPRVSLVSAVLLLATGIPDAPDRLAIAAATWTAGGAALLATIAVLVVERQYR